MEIAQLARSQALLLLMHFSGKWWEKRRNVTMVIELFHPFVFAKLVLRINQQH
jgi:hypothetical protein